jgi:Protein of unknown function (DUF4012)
MPVPLPPEERGRGGGGPDKGSASTSVLWRQNEGLEEQWSQEPTHSNNAPQIQGLWRADEGAREVVSSRASVSLPETRGDELWRADEGVLYAPETQPPDARSSRRKRESSPAHPNRAWSYLALITAIFLGLLVVDGIYVGVRMTLSLRAAGNDLQSAEAALSAGHVNAAIRSLHAADSSSATTTALTLHPSFVLASLIPGVDRDIDAVQALSDAAHLSTDAGKHLVQVVKTLGLPGDHISPSVYRNGQVELDTVAEVTPLVARATHLLGIAHNELLAQQPSLGALTRVTEGARLSVAGVLTPLSGTQQLISRLPSLLGRTTTRRYLLAFQALGEARGTGGVFGLYGVLTSRDGRIQLTHVGYFGNLIHGALASPVAAPKWFQSNYGPQFGTRQWQQVNLSPNFPAVSDVLLNMYQAATGHRLDGVIAMDPVALQDLLAATGPILSKHGPALTSDDAAQVLLRDSYIAFPDRTAQNRYLSSVVRQFWQKVSDGSVDPAAFSSGLRKAVVTQHLKMFSRTPRDQSALGAVGASGAFTDYGPNVQMVFNNNYSANKVDYYLRRRLHTTVQLTSSGQALVHTKVVLHNYAPPGPPSTLLGPAITGDPPGLNRMILNFLLPEQARSVKLTQDGRKAFPLRYDDSGRPLFWDLLALRSGERKTEDLTYRVPGAARITETQGEFRFVLFPQATVLPDRSSLTILPPRGWTITDVRGASLSHGAATLSGYFSTPEPVEVRLSRG